MTIVAFGKVAYFPVPISGVGGPLQTLSAKVSDYNNFYLALDSYGHLGVFPRPGKLVAGVSTPVTVTFSGVNSVGTAMPDAPVDLSFDGPTPPPGATAINVPPVSVQSPAGGFSPNDPGADTVSVPCN